MSTKADIEAKRKHDEIMENPEVILDDAKQETEKEKEKVIKEDPYYLGDQERL